MWARSTVTVTLSNLNPVKDFDLHQVIIYENTKDEYYTSCTPQAKKALDDYPN
jgi:hypothetical protein